jgi:hypothetical protein
MASAEQWRAKLKQFNETYQKTEVQDRWMPDDGEYTCVVESVDAREFEKNGKECIGWSIMARLLDGVDSQGNSLEGRVFQLAFATAVKDEQAYGVKAFAKGLAGGEAPADLPAAAEVIENSIGKVLQIRIETNEKGWKNSYVNQVIDS